MIIKDDIIQGSPEWFIEHAGKPGASSFNKIVTTKGEPSKQSDDYALQLAGEYILGTVEQGYASFAMQQGLDRENEARQLYEIIHDAEIRQVGMVYKDERQDRLCSPDGLMNSRGLEIKCPVLKTHIKYLLDKKLPTDYFCQVQGSLYITGFETWDFMSYYPGLDPFLITVERNEPFIEKLDKALDKFCMKIAMTVRRLKEE
ncbi:MAG: YqaJ viral recombinase family protein [Thermodesulfobacteriota bacterium]|nr:YqaJ viral recombinase family protein [Thermodesulfobacteriota bacterium]